MPRTPGMQSLVLMEFLYKEEEVWKINILGVIWRLPSSMQVVAKLKNLEIPLTYGVPYE